MNFIIVLQTLLILGLLFYTLWNYYNSGRQQQAAAISLLELIKAQQAMKSANVTNILQTKFNLNATDANLHVAKCLEKERLLIQQMITDSHFTKDQSIMFYQNLQDVLAIYYMLPTLIADKTVASEDDVTMYHAKFMKYLEDRKLIAVEIKKKMQPEGKSTADPAASDTNTTPSVPAGVDTATNPAAADPNTVTSNPVAISENKTNQEPTIST